MVSDAIVTGKQDPFTFWRRRAHCLKCLHPINLRTSTQLAAFRILPVILDRLDIDLKVLDVRLQTGTRVRSC